MKRGGSLPPFLDDFPSPFLPFLHFKNRAAAPFPCPSSCQNASSKKGRKEELGSEKRKALQDKLAAEAQRKAELEARLKDEQERLEAQERKLAEQKADAERKKAALAAEAEKAKKLQEQLLYLILTKVQVY